MPTSTRLANRGQELDNLLMLKRSEGFFIGYHDTKIYYQKWEHSNPKALAIITHGQGEHSDCYSRLIEALSPLNLSFIAWDLRGHGRSEGSRGYARDFFEYIHDYELFLHFIQQNSELKKLPQILMAHSMGGLIQMKAVLSSSQDQYLFQTLSAPMFGIGVKVPAYKDFAAKLLYQLAPQVTMWNEITHDFLTRDTSIITEFEKDALRHDKISSGVYLGSLRAMEFIHSKAKKLTLPTFIQIPEKDPVNSSERTRSFFENTDHRICQLKSYPDRKHEMYNDLGREEVFKDLKEYIQSKIN